MNQVARHILHAHNSREFEQTGEREGLEQSIARLCPDMSAEARRRVSRQIARGLDIFGREAINLGIQDLVTFESRLKHTPVQAMGYPASLRQTLQNAVRYLHVAARDGSSADLRQVLNIKRRRRNLYVAAEPLPMTPAQAGASAPKASTTDAKADPAASREQNKKKYADTPETGMPAAPTLADVDGVIDRLAALQAKIGTWDAQTQREVITMLVETFSDRAVLQLLAAVPGGFRQPVSEPADVPERPCVSAVARRVLTDALVSRRASLPQP